jgi:flagellar basal body-associated protein FliL
LTNPYVRFNGPIATVDPDTSNGDSNSMVIAIVIVVIIVGCCAAVYLFSKSKKKKSLGAKLDYSHFSTVRINL